MKLSFQCRKPAVEAPVQPYARHRGTTISLYLANSSLKSDYISVNQCNSIFYHSMEWKNGPVEGKTVFSKLSA